MRASTAQGQAGQRNPRRRVEPAKKEEAHLDAALVNRRQPAQDTDGEQVLVVDRDAVEAHAAERRRPGEEVGAGVAVRVGADVLMEKRRTWKRRLSITVDLLKI